MAKVPSDDGEDVLYAGDWLEVRAIRRRNGSTPASEWAGSLDKKGTGQLRAVCKIIETTLRAKRAPSGRLDKVKAVRLSNGQQADILEIRVTPKGGTPPHHRMLGVRSGNTLWVTHGFTKQKNKLQDSDITTAEAILNEWEAET